ncbi:unnamed protein product [Musa textilis]
MGPSRKGKRHATKTRTSSLSLSPSAPPLAPILRVIKPGSIACWAAGRSNTTVVLSILNNRTFILFLKILLEDAEKYLSLIRTRFMGAFCCCLYPEDFEEHAYSSNSIYRHCICLRYFFHRLLDGYGATFQRLDGHSVPSQIQITTPSSLSTAAGNAPDNSACETYHVVPLPQPYDADPRYSRLQREGLVSRREKSMNHTQEELHTLRRNGSSSAVETLGAIKKRNIAESEEGFKLTHPESEKYLSAKACDTSFVITTPEDEDVCPTCLEEYTPENPKIVANCSHHFHLSCIYEWMERSDTCPVCGKEMEFCESP